MATRITKLELSQALAERNAQLEAARLRIAELEGDVMALKSQFARVDAPRTPPVVRTGPRPVIEFDPNVVGDFRRAMNAARECGGVVRRVQH